MSCYNVCSICRFVFSIATKTEPFFHTYTLGSLDLVLVPGWNPTKMLLPDWQSHSLLLPLARCWAQVRAERNGSGNLETTIWQDFILVSYWFQAGHTFPDYFWAGSGPVRPIQECIFGKASLYLSFQTLVACLYQAGHPNNLCWLQTS